MNDQRRSMRSRFRLVLLTIVLAATVASGQVVMAPPAAAAGGTIYGHVTAPAGATGDIRRKMVFLHTPGGIRSSLINDAGDYTFTSVPVGDAYRVQFVSPQSDFMLDTYAPGVAIAAESPAITVTDGASVRADIQVLPAAVLEATVKGYVNDGDINPWSYWEVIGRPDSAATAAGAMPVWSGLSADGTARVIKIPAGHRTFTLRTQLFDGPLESPPDLPGVPDLDIVAGGTYQLTFTVPPLGVHRFRGADAINGGIDLTLAPVSAPIVRNLMPPPALGREPLPHGFSFGWSFQEPAGPSSPKVVRTYCGSTPCVFLTKPTDALQARAESSTGSIWVDSPDNSRAHAGVMTGVGDWTHSVAIPQPGVIRLGPIQGDAYLVDADGSVVSAELSEMQDTAVQPGIYNLYVVPWTNGPGDPAPYFYPSRPEDLGVPPVSLRVAAGQRVVVAPSTPAMGGVVKGRFYQQGGAIGWAPAYGTQLCLFTPNRTRTTRCGNVDRVGGLVVSGVATGRYLLGLTPSATARATGTKLTSATAYVTVDVVRPRTVDLGALNVVVRPFTDVPTSARFRWQIDWFRLRGFTTGYADGSFHPNEAVSREAMAAFFYRAAGSPAFVAPLRSPFVDVPRGAPFYKEICWLAAKGISTGWVEGNGTRTFRPKQAITRAAMAAFLYRAAGRPAVPIAATATWFADIHPGVPFEREITWTYWAQISTDLDPYDYFRPTYPMTRALLADFFYNWKTGHR